MMTNLQSSAQVAKTTQLLSTVARLRLLLVMLLTLTVSAEVWGATATLTLSSSKKFGTTSGSTLTDDQNNTWTCNGSNIQNTYNTTYKGQQFGTSKNAGNYTFACTIAGATISSVEITAAAGSTNAKYSISVGGSSKYSGNLSKTSTTYGGTNASGSGEISISLQGSGTGAAVYLGSITVVYTTAPADPYTVTFHTTATAETPLTEASAGDGVTPPTMEEECGDWTFQGWSESFSVSETSTTELELVTLTNGKYYPTEDVNLYPVYTKSGGGGGTAYTKVTTISEGVYVMVSEKTSGTYKYMPNTTSPDANPNLGSGITISTTSGITSLTNEVTDAMLWDFTSTGTANQFYLRPHGSTTIGLGCTASTGANIRISSAYKDVKWTITTSSDYGWQFKSNASSAMYLAVYSDSNWRNYTSSTTNQKGKFHLFKQTSSSTTYYFSYPQCSTETLVSVLPKIMNFWQSIFGVSLGYLRDKTRYRHVLGGIVVVSLHHRYTKIDFHHINMSRTAFVGLCLFVWQTTERFFV